MYEVVYLENRKEYLHFVGGVVDCRNFLILFLADHQIPFQVESLFLLRTCSGFFKIREVDFEKELRKLKALSQLLEISHNLPLDWNHASSLTKERWAGTPLL